MINRLKLKSLDTKLAAAKQAKAKEKAVWAMTEQAKADTRPYVPMLSGDLMRTAESQSRPKEGLLIYGSAAVDYARVQYYGFPHKRTSIHPLATIRWFEKSKAANKTKWERTAKTVYREAMKG